MSPQIVTGVETGCMVDSSSNIDRRVEHNESMSFSGRCLHDFSVRIDSSMSTRREYVMVGGAGISVFCHLFSFVRVRHLTETMVFYIMVQKEKVHNPKQITLRMITPVSRDSLYEQLLRWPNSPGPANFQLGYVVHNICFEASQ